MAVFLANERSSCSGVCRLYGRGNCCAATRRKQRFFSRANTSLEQLTLLGSQQPRAQVFKRHASMLNICLQAAAFKRLLRRLDHRALVRSGTTQGGVFGAQRGLGILGVRRLIHELILAKPEVRVARVLNQQSVQ